MFQPEQGGQIAWLIPAACVAIAVLLFAVLAMPAGWIVRRRCQLQGRRPRLHSWYS